MTDTTVRAVPDRLSAVLLDRDGTLVASPPEGDYLMDPDELRLLPGVATALRRLRDRDVALCVITNQRCVALGLCDLGTVGRVNERLIGLLHGEGVTLAGVYVCPHGTGECTCRKPGDGLVRGALDDLGVPGSEAAVIGDRCTDTAAGTRLGLFRVLVGAPPEQACDTADVVVRDLAAAVDFLLA